MNFDKYPWLRSLDSPEACASVKIARTQYERTGAVVFPDFISKDALRQCVRYARAAEDEAYTTDDTHTAYLQPKDTSTFHEASVYNHMMRTIVASTAYDELPVDSTLPSLYRDPTLIRMVAAVVGKDLFLSEDPLGCCSINVFRPGYYHSFHFDESEFSTTLMLQEAENDESGLFQYTHPLRQTPDDLAFPDVASTIHQYDPSSLDEKVLSETMTGPAPCLHTLDFRPGTLSIFSGSRSLHRDTKVEGSKSRLVAVLTFATRPGFRNSPEVQKLFWGRSL